MPYYAEKILAEKGVHSGSGYIFMLRTLIHFYHILSPQP